MLGFLDYDDAKVRKKMKLYKTHAWNRRPYSAQEIHSRYEWPPSGPADCLCLSHHATQAAGLCTVVLVQVKAAGLVQAFDLLAWKSKPTIQDVR